MGVDRGVHAFDALDGRRLWRCSAAGEALTLAQPGVRGGLQEHAAGRPGPAPDRRGPATWQRALGGGRGRHRAAPTRSSAWPTWSARRCARATLSAHAPSSRRWAAPMPSAARCCGARTSAARRPSAAMPNRGRRRRARPHHRLEDRHRRPGLDERAAALPRPERRRSSVGRRWSSATAKAMCTSWTAPTARCCCACPPMARRWSAAGAWRATRPGRHPQGRRFRLPPE